MNKFSSQSRFLKIALAKTAVTSLLVASSVLAAGCLQSGSEADESAASLPESGGAVVGGPSKSPVALDVERAGRMLDRGVDSAAAKALVEKAVANLDHSDPAWIDAVVELSRAHEALGDREQAITTVERVLAQPGGAPDNLQRVRDRLSQLLLPDKNNGGGYDAERTVSPFAKVLSQYSTVTDGRTTLQFYMAGGHQPTTHRLGTFNLGGALRAQRDADCPLCVGQLKVSNHVRQSDWTVIPERQAKFRDAFLVFYFDLESNRIPARYEAYLPMPVDEIETKLRDGKSFVMARERAGQPPVILLAAPRTSMLVEVEEHLAALDHLPTKAEYTEVSSSLRPHEIRRVIRSQMYKPLRGCYETLLLKTPEAKGRITVEFAVTADGSVDGVAVKQDADTLTDATFVKCVSDQAASLKFAVTGSKTTVKYPFSLRPE